MEVTLGAVKFDQGKVDEAGALLAQVLKAEPGNPDANFWMARVNDKKGNYSNAVESIRAALDRARPAQPSTTSWGESSVTGAGFPTQWRPGRRR